MKPKELIAELEKCNPAKDVMLHSRQLPQKVVHIQGVFEGGHDIRLSEDIAMDSDTQEIQSIGMAIGATTSKDVDRLNELGNRLCELSGIGSEDQNQDRVAIPEHAKEHTIHDGTKVHTWKKGDDSGFYAVRSDFVNMQVSIYGIGEIEEVAIEELVDAEKKVSAKQE